MTKTNLHTPNEGAKASENPPLDATLDTLDGALRCAISALPGLSASGTLAHNLHVAVRAASDVRGLLDIGQPEPEDYDPTNVRAAVSVLTRQAVDMQHEIGVLRSEFGLNGSVARPRSDGYPAQAEPDDLPSTGAETDGSLVLDAETRENVRGGLVQCEEALRELLSDSLSEDKANTLEHLHSLATGLDWLDSELRAGVRSAEREASTDGR
jgi:hypothetical protein